MAKNTVEIPAKPQDYLYRQCRECTSTIYDTRVLKRKVYEIVATNQGHGVDCPQR